ncbi:MAG TPA: sigma factor, partial [Gemmataceae bacterium]|jgi:DNA-directed RNA polymerase specialized sigma24 family protein|nr:sigma factor [Gemmataceae bacterium]
METFDSVDSFEVRSYPHQPTTAERDAVRLLRRLGWSSPKIVIDDLMAALSNWKTRRTPRRGSDDVLARFYATLDAHRPLAEKLVRELGLDATADDLMQEVILRLCRKWDNRPLRDESAATAFIQICLKNMARTMAARQRVRPVPAVFTDGDLADPRASRSAEAERAMALVERVQLRLGPEGRLALACALGTDDLQAYRERMGCSRVTASRDFATGMRELADRIREAQAEGDE